MKKQLLFFILIVSFSKIVLAQYTPYCTDISGDITTLTPLTQSQINSINSSQQLQFPNAVKLEEPTASYNCHNYAWVKRDGGAAFWLNSPGDDAFWNDNSYVVSSNTTIAELRVSYQGDHTAVTTGTANECVSKWGQWGLYRHNTTYVPSPYLPYNTLTYYKKNLPTIAGAVSPCSNPSYSVNNLPTGASVSWSVTGTFSVSNANDYPVTVSGDGYGTLTALITTTCGGQLTVTKNLTPVQMTITPGGNGYCGEATVSINSSGGTYIWTVTGDLDINASGQTLTTSSNTIAITGTNGTISVTGGPCSISLNESYSPYVRPIVLSVNPIYNSEPLVAVAYIDFGYSALRWYIDGSLVSSGTDPMYYDSNGGPCGTHTLSLEADLDCGATGVLIGSVEFERYCSWGMFAAYPNPASNILTVESTEGDAKSEKEFTAYLYDDKGKLISKIKNKGKGFFNTSDIPSGTYYLHMQIEGKKVISKKQIIIRH